VAAVGEKKRLLGTPPPVDGLGFLPPFDPSAESEMVDSRSEYL
jgi:hypothetical protein